MIGRVCSCVWPLLQVKHTTNTHLHIANAVVIHAVRLEHIKEAALPRPLALLVVDVAGVGATEIPDNLQILISVFVEQQSLVQSMMLQQQTSPT